MILNKEEELDLMDVQLFLVQFNILYWIKHLSAKMLKISSG